MDKEKKEKDGQAVPIRPAVQPMPKQQALPLLCREEKKQERALRKKSLIVTSSDGLGERFKEA